MTEPVIESERGHASPPYAEPSPFIEAVVGALERSPARKHDAGKARLDLIPPEMIDALGAALTHGAAIYGDRNWERGMEWGRAHAALLRHLNAWTGGEDADPDSGLPHLAHAACNLAFLIAWQQRGIGTDDRCRKGR